MKDKDREQAQKLVDQIQATLNRVFEAIADPLKQLEHLLHRTSEEEKNFARMRELQKLDPLRGDYQHRPPGKHPLDPRFRFYDESAPFGKHQYDVLTYHRTHREKSDMRRGRKN